MKSYLFSALIFALGEFIFSLRLNSRSPATVSRRLGRLPLTLFGAVVPGSSAVTDGGSIDSIEDILSEPSFLAADGESNAPRIVNHHPRQYMDAALLNQLLKLDDVTDFTAALKDVASMRYRMQDIEKATLIKAVVQRIDKFDAELLSNCIWSLGTLKCSIDDFLGDVIVSSTFMNKVSSISETATRLFLFRIAIGLSKMGLQWDSLPALTRARYLQLMSGRDSERALQHNAAEGVEDSGMTAAA